MKVKYQSEMEESRILSWLIKDKLTEEEQHLFKEELLLATAISLVELKSCRQS